MSNALPPFPLYISFDSPCISPGLREWWHSLFLQTGNRVLAHDAMLPGEGVGVHTIIESRRKSHCKCTTISAPPSRRQREKLAFCVGCCLLMKNFWFHGVIGDATSMTPGGQIIAPGTHSVFGWCGGCNLESLVGLHTVRARWNLRLFGESHVFSTAKHQLNNQSC